MKVKWSAGQLVLCVLAACLAPGIAGAVSLADTVVQVKPSIVGVGSMQATRRPPAVLRGTGFVVADGRYVVTNAHVVAESVDSANLESLAVFPVSGERERGLRVRVVSRDRHHDLALLRLETETLPPLTLGDSASVREGEDIAFTGFPIGPVLGLHPATHRGVIAASTPIALRGSFRAGLSATRIRRLDDPYAIFQLDATAYPGNSGSPVYDPGTGVVLGVINKVFVQASKEDVLARPSGITYAIPVQHVYELLHDAGVFDEAEQQ